jgi:hypothetical protein
MSKKQKRNISQGNRQAKKPVSPIDQPLSSVPTPTRITATPAPRPYSPQRSGGSSSTGGTRRYMPAPEFKPDYSYVVKDLKRIGILAGSFISVLIVLSFILK